MKLNVDQVVVAHALLEKLQGKKAMDRMTLVGQLHYAYSELCRKSVQDTKFINEEEDVEEPASSPDVLGVLGLFTKTYREWFWDVYVVIVDGKLFHVKVSPRVHPFHPDSVMGVESSFLPAKADHEVVVKRACLPITDVLSWATRTAAYPECETAIKKTLRRFEEYGKTTPRPLAEIEGKLYPATKGGFLVWTDKKEKGK